MTVLSFSLSPEATARVYELLQCLAKFGDAVSIEARSGKLTLTALNSSRTAYASFALDASVYFVQYDFNANAHASGGDRFTCQLLNKALQSVFKGRGGDARGRDVGIDQCKVSIQDQPDKTQCRLVVKMISGHGLTKTYRLTYESVEVMHALFDKSSAKQGWRISSRVLREYVEYFGQKTEQLDILAQGNKAVFTSFTEKIQDGKEVLKQPLETAIAIHTEDFEDFHMQEGVHIVISVKDFTAIVTHAETLRGPISAHFSSPSRPLQFSYQNFGIHCEFTLMTNGGHHENPSSPDPRFVSTRSESVLQSTASSRQNGASAVSMPPPARTTVGKPLSSQTQRPPLREQARPSFTFQKEDPDPESLFIPNGDSNEDQAWDPPDYDHDEDEMLGWDASNDNFSASMRPTIRDLNTQTSEASRPSRDSGVQSRDTQEISTEGLAPTQRLSQLHGMFD